MLNNDNELGSGTIENFLKKITFKRQSSISATNAEALKGSEKRKGSVMMVMVHKEFKN